jgi:hypothetical protein
MIMPYKRACVSKMNIPIAVPENKDEMVYCVYF